MAWIYLFIGALFEIGWAVGLKMSEGFTRPIISGFTLLSIFISFFLFTKALKMIDIGTGYAIFTGIGAAGTAVIGMAFLGDIKSAGKVFFIAVLIFGIIGLKMSDTPKVEVLTEEGL
ncbi:DMT family transporter [Halobacillus amylolyticus]|uniref:Multidrug efflux SMR transporter n=1 Tax=Halobacillus amylolyticus TaxID=2932259 RepID=A0ABY4HF59_9BACI|nr:multidrug efflux SMR transporter [Halobacillus amylolyticus]UOR13379.1 multidrug efflux SMR transporter [Halobacillus amylolyticus]